jgi:hypothetical protein
MAMVRQAHQALVRHSRACRVAILLVADKAINAIGCSGTEQPDCPNLWDGNKEILLGLLTAGTEPAKRL